MYFEPVHVLTGNSAFDCGAYRLFCRYVLDAIQLDERNDDKYDEEVAATLKTIEKRLGKLQGDLEMPKKKGIM